MARQTFAQRRAEVRRALSKVKKELNNENGLLEIARREASRLLQRKTIITPDDLEKLEGSWNACVMHSAQVVSALTNLFYISNASV